MRYTPNYNMVIGEGTDAVNPLTQIFPNFETIDTAMENNKNAGITTASEVTTGGVHAIVRVNTSAPVFRFTATSAWTTGDTMTLDGSAVTVHLTDGTAPKSGAYVIGAEVVGIVNGSLVTLLAGSSFEGVTSFNGRQNAVLPQSGDYTANMIGYNNTNSGLAATDVQSAIDEVANMTPTVDKVTYTATGSKDFAGCLADIWALVDISKVSGKTVLEYNTAGTVLVFPIAQFSGSGLMFTCDLIGLRMQYFRMGANNDYLDSTASGTQNYTTQTPAVGTTFTIIY